MTKPAIVLMLCFIGHSAVFAQAYRCTTPAGSTVFSDRPCSDGDRASAVRLQQYPAAESPSPKSPGAYQADRQRRAEASKEENRRIDDNARRIAESGARVRQIKTENADPKKCAAARSRIANAQRRDPIGSTYDPDVMEMKQKANLYCGP